TLGGRRAISFRLVLFFFITTRPPPGSPLFPYTTLFRSGLGLAGGAGTGLGLAKSGPGQPRAGAGTGTGAARDPGRDRGRGTDPRSEEHTSELQSRENLVCRLLLEKKKK